MGADSTPTVMVVDDHPIWRDAVARDLAEGGFTVVATADGVAAARRRAGVVHPDVVVMDMRLSDGDGAQATAEVLAVSPSSRILVLSASDEREDVLEAVKAGATGYLVKSASKQELGDAVRATAEGRAVFTPGLAGLVLGEYRRIAQISRTARPGTPMPEPDRARDRDTAARREGTDREADRRPAVVEPPHRREPRPSHLPQAPGRKPGGTGSLRDRTRARRVVLLIRKRCRRCHDVGHDRTAPRSRRPAVLRLHRHIAVHGEGLDGPDRAGPPAVRAAAGRPAGSAAVPGAALAAVSAAICAATAAGRTATSRTAGTARRAEGAARRGLDREAARRRRSGGHPGRRCPAARARRPGGPSASRVPGRGGRGFGRRTGGSGRMAVPPARWTGRCHRPGRYGRRRGLHGRHRRHDHLRLGVRAGRPGRRRDHRRWRPDPGPQLGLSTPRCAGVGSAHRARARGGRRDHPAPRQLHAGARRRVSAGATGQGLDLAAQRSHRGQHVSADHRPACGLFR